MYKKMFLLLAVISLFAIAFAGCAPAAAEPQTVEVEVTRVVEVEVEKEAEAVEAPMEEEAGPLKVYAVFAAIIEEPWDGVIHAALTKAEEEGKITYDFIEEVGYSGDMERVLNEVAEQQQPDIIFGDAFGNEEQVRRAAAANPEIAFVFGSGLGPVDPNMSVFDNWIHEPAYLAGMLAGGLTESNTIGVVGGYPVPEVNRITNAFIAGAKEVNPDVKVLVTFINSWFDPAAAKEATLAQVDNGADVFYAERFGVIEAAAENGFFSFGNMTDQNELAPEFVISSVSWNLTPTVEYILSQVSGGTYTAQDLKDFNMWAKGGATLAPYHGTEDKIPADLLDMVETRKSEIETGLFRVDIDEAQPAAVN